MLSNNRYLAHYASPYYDPVKAHEYYMKNRELVGRKSTTGLNDEGKLIARSTKQYLDDQKKGTLEENTKEKNAKLESYKVRMTDRTKDRQNLKNTQTEQQKKLREEQLAKAANDKTNSLNKEKNAKESGIEQHAKQMSIEIDRIQNQLDKMNSKEKALYATKLQADIDNLRNENAKKRQELTLAYENSKASIDSKYQSDKAKTNSDYDSAKKGIDESYTKDKANIDNEYNTSKTQATEEHKVNAETIKKQYEDLYINELDKLKGDARYKAVKKGKSSKSSAGTTAKPRKQTQTSTRSRISYLH